MGAASAFGAALGLREGLVRYRAAMLIGAVGMLLAPLGVRLAHTIPNTPLMVAFSLLLAWVAWRTFDRARGDTADASTHAGRHALRARPGRRPAHLDAALRAGAGRHRRAVGLLSGLLGVGGGFVIVPALSRFTNVRHTRHLRHLAGRDLAGLDRRRHGRGAARRGALASGAALRRRRHPGDAGRAQVAARLAGARLQQGFALVSAAVALLLLARALGWLAM